MAALKKNKIGDKGGFMNRKAILALARSFAQDRIEAKIPFAFNVGPRSLPSGSYELRKAFANTLVIQNAITHQAAMAITTVDSPNQIEGDAVVVFHKYG